MQLLYNNCITTKTALLRTNLLLTQSVYTYYVFTSLWSTAGSIDIPCSVKAYGMYLLPPWPVVSAVFEMPVWHLKNSSSVSWKQKSSRNLFSLRFIARFNAPVSTWYNFAKSQSSITCLSLIVYIRFLPLYYPMQKETAHMRSVPRSLQKYTTVKPFQFCSTGFHFLYGRSGGWICYSQRNKYNNFSHVMWFLNSRSQ